MPSPLILVVDDDRDTRELYKLVFEVGGYRVAEANSVAEGRRTARALRPDVILTDWRLGDGNALTFCEALRRHGPTRRIPVIVATGMSLPPDAIAAARRLGCEHILIKPLALDALVRVAAGTLQIAKARTLRAAAVRIRRYASRVRQDASGWRGGSDVQSTAKRLVAAARVRPRSHVALIIADDRGRYVAVNDEASALTGYNPQELTTLSVEDLAPQGQAPVARQLWSRFIGDGIQEGVYTLRRRDGISVEMRYVAVANVTPGLHLSALSATSPIEHPLLD
jgi:PAS domain S-box-containing protein